MRQSHFYALRGRVYRRSDNRPLEEHELKQLERRYAAHGRKEQLRRDLKALRVYRHLAENLQEARAYAARYAA